MTTAGASSEGSKQPTVGICCSGGGIRAASFALGCLQILDEKGVLRGPGRADYISAVSGGSYAVGAMAVLEHHRQADDQRSELLPDIGPYAPESPEFRRLRNRLTYLTHPSEGLPAEIWRAVMGVAMNLVLFSAVATVFGFALGWAYGRTLPQLNATCQGRARGCSTAVRPSNGVFYCAAALGVLALVLGLVWVGRRWSLRVNRWLQNAALGAALTAAAYALFVLGLPQVLVWLHQATLPKPPVAVTVSDGLTKNYWVPASGLAGALAAIGALFGPVWSFLRPKVEAEGTKWLQNLMSKYRTQLLNLVAFLAVPALFGGLLLLFMHIGAEHPPFVNGTSDWRLLYLVVPIAVIGTARKFGDLNNWSLHTLYKERLAEAFAVARFTPPSDRLSTSRVTQKTPPPHDVDADHKHSGLIPLDAAQPVDFPRVLICATSNTTSYGVAPSGTGALPFLFSSKKVGGDYVGDLETSEYERWGFRRVGDLTIMDAVSISGAAVSPEMGRMTRPPLRFLMALANLRLGVWLPKPGRVKDHIYGDEPPPDTRLAKIGWWIMSPVRKVHEWRIERLTKRDEERVDAEPPPRFFRRNIGALPQPSVQRLVNEALGTTPAKSRFVYVTDGGHFDNLGLVELLKRGCDRIWCIDASGDQVDTFNTLGLALSIAKSEYGIDVAINPFKEMAPEAPAKKGTTPIVQRPFCIGTIKYPPKLNASEGELVLVKAGVPKNAGLDLVTFHNENPKFPCDPTTNQLYTAERFDAYVALGRLSMATAYKAVVETGTYPAGASRG